jgi:hypothetical protein
MTATSQYRSNALAGKVIAFSVSYQPDNLLARGMGFEHLNELLIRLARPILRQSADLAYGGHWEETEGNFTYPLLRLISAEQEDNSIGGPDTNFKIGKLYNHSAWPHYLKITPRIEAQWINCCRIVRITQQIAGIAEADVVPDADAATDARAGFNQAVTLSAMRRLMMAPMPLAIPDAARREGDPDEIAIPPVVARILLGGKADGYAGFLPGIFEEALVTLQHARPTYLLGGFGGATEILSRAMLSAGADRPAELTLDWHLAHNPDLADLLETCRQGRLPALLAGVENSLDALFGFVLQARGNLAATLNTGLSQIETRELLATVNVANAVHLVRKGLANTDKLPKLQILPA